MKETSLETKVDLLTYFGLVWLKELAEDTQTSKQKIIWE